LSPSTNITQDHAPPSQCNLSVSMLHEGTVALAWSSTMPKLSVSQDQALLHGFWALLHEGTLSEPTKYVPTQTEAKWSPDR
jgi:hypothetical protein